MGLDARTSVVNPDFQLHDHPNWFAADSSIFPRSPGINPSLSIMALSVRAARVMLAARGNSPRPDRERPS